MQPVTNSLTSTYSFPFRYGNLHFCNGMTNRTFQCILANLLRDKDKKPLRPKEDLVKETDQSEPHYRSYIHSSKRWNQLSGCHKKWFSGSISNDIWKFLQWKLRVPRHHYSQNK
ncbi:hypothetical protein QQP08_011035 [Theobroma cacao]|nr:hypothetical protein QQP08_011035 [Theobroma cacao]